MMVFFVEMAAICLLLLFAFFPPLLLHAIEDPQQDFLKQYCPAVNCTNLVGFPFTNSLQDATCGPFVVDCGKGHQQIKLDRESNKWYQLESISQSSSTSNISVTDTELLSFLNSKSCASFNINGIVLPNVNYIDFQISPNLKSLFKCNKTTSSSLFEFNYTKCPDFNIFYTDLDELPHSVPLNQCSTIQLPAYTRNSYQDIFDLLTASFSLRVTISPESYSCNLCELRGGKCQADSIKAEMQCAYPNGTASGMKPEVPQQKGKTGLAWKLALGVGCGASVVLTILLLVASLRYRHDIEKVCSRFLPANSTFCFKNPQDRRRIEVFLKNHPLTTLKRYNYSGVKKMTSSFTDKLGQGGYGSVFKGKLSDGKLVAVKVLKESKRNGEEFINEVASISRTSHVNVVTLLGFCCEGSRQALIYEFMPNGSLDKYIYEDDHLKNDRNLGWETLFQIAVGIAKGLEYLHRGCNTRILHFDIKPHNILLDENFSPKISDFGLSKICPMKESMISMIDARGTAGYIAPEVFCKSFGGVSHKSDVYSYGMLVLEMVGGRRNICATVDHTSEIYFPHWVFKRLELGDELGLHGIGNEEDNQLARKMVLASLWCIQTDPSNRPAISKVIEMLLGSLESLPVPPKP